MQLGWMAIWLLWGEVSSPHVKFHEMRWETMPRDMQDVNFIHRAMKEGDVKDEYLSGHHGTRRSTTVQ